MRVLLRVVSISILCLVATAFGQQPVSAVYIPGDVIRVAVTLAEPAKVRVECSFSRTTEYKPDYTGTFTTDLRGGSESNVLPQSAQSEYLVSVKIPDFAASGTYRLDSVTITIPTGQSKTYSGSDVGNLIIEIRNPPPHFPAIKSIAIASAK